MKKQPLLRTLIVAVIISAAFFVMAATRSSQQPITKEECAGEKVCEENVQSEFLLQSLVRNLLSR